MTAIGQSLFFPGSLDLEGEITTGEFKTGSQTTICRQEIECFSTPTVMHRSECHLCCAVCSKQVLLACPLNQYKQTSGSAQKYTYSLEWLQSFTTSSDVFYVCISRVGKYEK